MTGKFTHSSSWSSKEVFWKVAALAPLLDLCSLGGLLSALPLRLFLCNLGGDLVINCGDQWNSGAC